MCTGPFPSAARYRQAECNLVRRTEDAILLLPMDADEPFALHGTSVCIWDAIQSPATIAELCDRLAHRYGDSDRLRSDVEHIVERLLTIGAVRWD